MVHGHGAEGIHQHPRHKEERHIHVHPANGFRDHLIIVHLYGGLEALTP
jgi:hypothetical protein